ncbi:MAG: hypothetical protein H0T20_03560 [Actinobacteria bacterium]|nr:hypothetical protein [Actinomycetota bacterium]
MRVAERLSLARHEPWIVLAPLVVAQWVVLAAFALTVQRNGWLFYQGGDQTWFYTSAWELAHGRIPETLVGYLWPFVLAPLALLAGPNFLDGLPVIILLQVLVLAPIALFSAYWIAARIGGRLLGYFAAAAWIVAPFAAQPLFVGRYHERWNEQTLPQALGFTALGDFPSMVLLLVAAVFVLRALDGGARGDVIAAGIVVGLAIALKPANGLFVFAPLAAFALAHRWRAGLEFALALTPALLTLAVWKYRGTGISVLALDPSVLAAAAEPPPHPSELPWWEQVRDFVPLDIDQLNHQFLGFREYFWSARLLEFIPVAGVIAVARRSIPKAAFFAVWLAAFFVVKGSSPAVSVETATIWRLLMPAWPAYFFLAVSLPLLVPVWGARLPERFPAPIRVVRWPRRALVPVALLLAVPLIGSTLLPPSKGQGAAKLPLQSLFLPVDQDVGLAVAPVEGGLDLSWRAPKPHSAESFFIVYRSPLEYTLSEGDPRVIRQGKLCEPTGQAPRCTIEMTEVGRTRTSRFVDRVGPGQWTYRVGTAANWLDDESRGDPFVISRPLNISVE